MDRVYEWMYGWMCAQPDQWMSGWIHDECMDAQPDQWLGGWMHSRTNVWLDGCTVGPMDGRMDAQPVQ